MARGKHTSLADLRNAVGENSPVETLTAAPARAGLEMPLKDLVANPRNPRDDLGDLEDLRSIVDNQLQPVVAVSKSAYLSLYPDDDIATRYVVVNGCRRLAAAHKFGRTDLAVVVNDKIAQDRITLISASIAENVDRKGFDVIEEAKAVEALVKECGRGDEAALRLRKTGAWVSQRRALLKLAPELQTALRRGELAVREARSLALVPMEQQVARWRAALDKTGEEGQGNKPDSPRPASPGKVLAKAVADFDAKPEVLAEVLRSRLGEDGVARLVTLWAT